MKSRALTLAALAILGVAVFACFWWFGTPRWGDGLEAHTDNDAPMTQRALIEELDSLKQQIARLKAESDAPRAYAATPEPAPPEPSDAGEEEPTARVEPSVEEKLNAAVSFLDKRFSSEPVDVEWSRAAARQLQEAIAANASSSHVVSAECASSLCRIVMDHETEADQKSVVAALVDVEPFREGAFYKYDNKTTSPRTTIYLVREGRSFREGAESP